MCSQPDIFLDRCLDNNRIASALTNAGFRVHRMREQYPEQGRYVTDEQWLNDCGTNRWITLT